MLLLFVFAKVPLFTAHPVSVPRLNLLCRAPGATVSFTPMRFEISPLITLRYHLMYAKVSFGSKQFAVFFFPEYQVNFFGYDRLVSICFYQLLSYDLLSYEMVSYSFFACGYYFAQHRFCKVCIFYILLS